MLRCAAPAALIAVLAIALAFRCPYLEQRSVWYDEASSWQTAQFAITELGDRLEYNVHQPLYYLVLKQWMRLFGASPRSLRGLSIALGLAVVAASYRCAICVAAYSRLGLPQTNAQSPDDYQRDRWFGVFCALLVATNAFQVHASVEARMYPLGMLLTLASTTLLISALAGAERRTWAAYVLCATASLYTHHFALFSILAQFVFAAAFCFAVNAARGRARPANSSRLAWRVAASAAAVSIGFLPGFLLQQAQVTRIQQGYWLSPLNRWTVPETLFEMFLPVYEPSRGELILISSLAMVVAVTVWRRGQWPELLILSLAALPFLFAAVVSWAVVPIWHPRYFRLMHSFCLLAVALAIWKWTANSTTIRGVIASGLIVANLAATTAFWRLREIPLKPGMRGVTARIETAPRSVRGPDVFVVWHMHYFPAKYYLGSDRVRYLPLHGRPAAQHLLRPLDYAAPSDLPAEFWLIAPTLAAEPPLTDHERVSAETFEYDNGTPHSPIVLMRFTRNAQRGG
jgi:hypothetical protein